MTPTKAAIDEALRVGEQMSNVCFNLSQHAGEPLDKRTAETMKQLQREWDVARSVVRGQQKRKRVKGVAR